MSDQNSIMDAWNCEKIQYIRKIVLEDQLEKICNMNYCHYAAKSEYINLETAKNDDPRFNHIIDQIMEGRTVLDSPPYELDICTSALCNLNCTTCHSKPKYKKVDHQLEEKLYTQIIPEILPGISRLFLNGAGEVFFNPYSRKFLQSLDSNRYPSLQIHILTNGTLFTPKLWESIRQNRYAVMSVSIDAASQETYEKLRRNGNWNILRRNLDFMSELRRQNAFYWFAINFVVMKSNFREMKEFVELGRKLGCDQINFQRIYGPANTRENINFTQNKKIFREVAEILQDPIFDLPEVNTAQINDYRKYAGKKISWMDNLKTQLLEKLFYWPAQALLLKDKYLNKH
ncbi:MAG TPA: radical SAM protein [Bacillota bacterium]|nr:radical SAM protein [Bacillota bacterium]